MELDLHGSLIEKMENGKWIAGASNLFITKHSTQTRIDVNEANLA